MTAALLLAALVAGPQSHQESNPVFQQLLQRGVLADGNKAGRLPPPTMPDGLPAAQQRKVIADIGGARHTFADLARNSVVAPHITHIPRERIDSGDADLPLQSIEFWFVAHADLQAMNDKDFLNSLLGQEDGEGRSLSAQDLAARGIELVDAEHDGYGQIKFDLLKKVQLLATGRSFWSRTDESIVTAAVIDPRFLNDEQFPNQWRPLNREGEPLDDPHPYGGAGLYMKITQLQEPAGTVFVECHILGLEPVGWFQGVNLLRSKLPPVIQNQVRNARREMILATRKQRTKR